MSHRQAIAQQWMEEALNEAKLAQSKGEVPIGAIVVHRGSTISRAHNLVESLNDATAHAEILALRKAASALGRWRLQDCSLIVTLEPCSMCLAAARLSRIDEIIFGALDERFGSVGRPRDLSKDPLWGPTPRLLGGVCSDKSLQLMQSFFKELRGRSKNSPSE